MKKYKFFAVFMLLSVLILGQTFSVSGKEHEWYILQEIEEDVTDEVVLGDELEVTPYTRYILGASATLIKPSSGVLKMRSEVFCTETMSKITTVFTVQKKVGSSWVDVGQGTVSTTNDNSMYKTMQATGVTSGTYRCIADTQVISKTGYAETVSVISNTIS